MCISMIAAVGKNLELGKGNDLIWHFKEDMKFFKEVTTGNAVIMGRKTFESLPKALPNRLNIVISSDKSYVAEGAIVVNSVEDAIDEAGKNKVFVIGGGMIYKQFLPIAEKLYLTEIEDDCAEADVYFPDFNKSDYSRECIAVYNVEGTHFEHVLYTKKSL